MSDGLKFLTCGGCEELIVGNDYAATIGMTNYTYIGTETTLNLGLTNDINLGAKFSIEGGHKFEWTHVGGYTLEEGHVFELGDTVAKQVGESLTFTAGYGLYSQPAAETLNGLKSGLKKAVLTMTLMNAGAGLLTSGLLVGLSEGESEQEGWKPIVGASAEAVALGVTTAVVYGVLVKAMKTLAATYKALEKVSTMKMDSNGISQLACFETTGSSIILSTVGVGINAGLPGVAQLTPFPGVTVQRPLSSLLVCPDGNTSLSGNVSATLKSAASVKVGQVEENVLTSGLSATVAEVVLKNAATAITLTEATAGLRSPEVTIFSGGVNGYSANLAETKMAWGESQVTADVGGVLLSAGPVSSLWLSTNAVLIDVPLIQLG